MMVWFNVTYISSSQPLDQAQGPVVVFVLAADPD